LNTSMNRYLKATLSQKNNLYFSNRIVQLMDMGVRLNRIRDIAWSFLPLIFFFFFDMITLKLDAVVNWSWGGVLVLLWVMIIIVPVFFFIQQSLKTKNPLLFRLSGGDLTASDDK